MKVQNRGHVTVKPTATRVYIWTPFFVETHLHPRTRPTMSRPFPKNKREMSCIQGPCLNGGARPKGPCFHRTFGFPRSQSFQPPIPFGGMVSSELEEAEDGDTWAQTRPVWDCQAGRPPHGISPVTTTPGPFSASPPSHSSSVALVYPKKPWVCRPVCGSRWFPPEASSWPL